MQISCRMRVVHIPKVPIIVKELRDASGNIVGSSTIMLQRGGNFNTAGNGQ